MNKETIKRLLVAASLLLAISFLIAGNTSADSQAQNEGAGAPQQNSDAPENVGNANQWAFLLQQSPPAAQATPAPATTQEKTAAQQFKNIQVLKELPASQLFPIMHLFNTSLGVRCDTCHVKDEKGEMIWDRDDKQEKKTARRMIQMTLDINKNTFNNRVQVSCFTCHQGHEHPVSVPALPAAIVPAAPPPPAAGAPPAAPPVPTMPQPAEILEKYVKAIGGKEAIAKIKSSSLKGTYVPQRGTASVPLEVLQSPTKVLISVTTPQGTNSRGFNGTTGWTKNTQETRELDAEETNTIKDLVEAFDTLKLKEPFPQMRMGGKTKINDHEVYVLRGALPDRRRVTLYFDVQTGLLVRKEILSTTPIGLDPTQFDFDDYRDVDGVKIPFTIRTSYSEPGFSGTRKFTEIKHNLSIDETKFDLPKK